MPGGGRPCSAEAATRRRSTHKGKSGIARDLNVSKTGHLTIAVVQANGERFKTLGRNVVVSR
ncbi:MAG: hypothetical protein KA175_09240 [Flavobacteriales bacterium]|nr:hypothetical protein [Flavobacteriales bacterium]MBP7407609.1 hypothetical protein [Flavobacteriales bacterium]